MAKGGKLASAAADICRETIEAMGLDLVDVDFLKEGKHQILRLFIDKRGGISLDDCADATRAVNPLLDASFPWSGPYLLELSSPGLDRPLKSLQDFERHLGEEVVVRFYKNLEGKKEISGFLKEASENEIVIQITNERGEALGPELTLALSECAKISRSIRF